MRSRHISYVRGTDAAERGALVEGSPFPSGSWRGYYTFGRAQHGVCAFELSFLGGGEVRGAGVDDVGAYAIRGAHEGGRVAFTKQYERGSLNDVGTHCDGNLGHAVEYRGSPARLDGDGRAALGGGLRGTWSIRDAEGNHDGNWHLWPAMASQQWGHASAAAAGTGDDECCVCYDARIDCRLEPCGHVALCEGCATRLVAPRRCPLCRADIRQIVALRPDGSSAAAASSY